ncbi:MAG: hypothetical protein N3F07_00240 [Candidatus Micrarchaeota archaeon]|nr:hypothetical protein [Candidatus Micrarchaeota archaeon]
MRSTSMFLGAMLLLAFSVAFAEPYPDPTGPAGYPSPAAGSPTSAGPTGAPQNPDLNPAAAPGKANPDSASAVQSGRAVLPAPEKEKMGDLSMKMKKEKAAETLRARQNYAFCQLDFAIGLASQMSAASPAPDFEAHLQKLQQTKEALAMAAASGDEGAYAKAMKEAQKSVAEASKAIANLAKTLPEEQLAAMKGAYLELKQQMASCRSEALMALGSQRAQQEEKNEALRAAIASRQAEKVKETLEKRCIGSSCVPKEKYLENAKGQIARLQSILDKAKAKGSPDALAKAQAKLDEANALVSKSSVYDEEVAQKLRSLLAEAASLVKEALSSSR